MLLYRVKEGEELEKLSKLSFSDSDVCIVDDNKAIYIWFGKKANDKSKEFAIKKARLFNKERKESAKLLLQDQGQEYGEFFAMMDKLKEGLRTDDTIERRPELVLEEPWLPAKIESEATSEVKDSEKAPLGIVGEISDSVSKVTTLIEPKAITEVSQKKEGEIVEEPEEEKGNLEDDIRVKAYLISQQGLSYDILCWLLAETQLKIQKGPKNVTENEIRNKAEQVFKSTSTYDELCWLMAELNTLIEKGYFEMEME